MDVEHAGKNGQPARVQNVGCIEGGRRLRYRGNAAILDQDGGGRGLGAGQGDGTALDREVNHHCYLLLF